MKNGHRRLASAVGFSIVDVLGTLAIIGTVSAMAAPQISGALDLMRLGMSLRDVEREMQFARLKAVSANRPMRLRFDCPAAGSIRVVEVIGTPAVPDVNDDDSVTNRCSEAIYPYSPTGADRSRLTRPNNDGAVRRVYTGSTFTAKKTLEFWADGSVHADAGTGNPWPNIGSVGATITLSRKSKTKNITVNGLGKILMDR